MAGVNKVILIGNLGKDPEVRHLESGVSVANFPIATTESYKSKDGNKVEHTEWHNIVLWRGLAEISEKYLKKGDKVYIEGRIRTRQWDDKDGNKRYTTEILCDNMNMLGGARNLTNEGKVEGKIEEPPPEQKDGGDLPF
ncbi:MAG: single-stranded DNA-binding protein [Bacteroidales bacterium]|nr:single-stranded DNA-binding protein [Bacteroidales bacterium]